MQLCSAQKLIKMAIVSSTCISILYSLLYRGLKIAQDRDNFSWFTHQHMHVIVTQKLIHPVYLILLTVIVHIRSKTRYFFTQTLLLY